MSPRLASAKSCSSANGRASRTRAFAFAVTSVEGFRPSYRNLAWCLKRTGYDVDQELPGEDRPETVETLMRKVEDWAGL